MQGTAIVYLLYIHRAYSSRLGRAYTVAGRAY